MIRVLTIIGTRPEAIKMAPVLKLLARDPQRFESLVCVTGQHREMLHQALDIFGIVPDIDLDCMTQGQSLTRLTARLFEGIGGVLDQLKPDWVLAQGDTTTVFVAAMSAFYSGIRFAHVEAGLRTGDLRNPFPEEVNRKFADTLAELCFAPTDFSRDQLLKEGCPPAKVVLTGNTVVDALGLISGLPYRWADGPLAALDREKRLVLVTAHRRESFGAPIREICQALRLIARECAAEGVQLVYPVHLNPEVREPVLGLLQDVANVSLLEPLDYVSLVQLMRSSELILTDSGGIQEEAPSFQVPVLIMRDKTERPEGVQAGVARLVGTSAPLIAASALELLRDPQRRSAMRCARNPYGDGRAAERIVAELLTRSGP
jgi:UDP-N-acetylglucosamine 2-epimerase (non-hydrolysing)